MYLEYYGLREAPFSITPDPRYVFLSDRHRDALAHLLYGIGKGGSGGFVQLTGEVGTGKTTLCRLLLEQLPDNTRVALVLNPKLSPVELVEAVCEELKLDITGRQGSLKALTDSLNAFLLDAYSRTVSEVVERVAPSVAAVRVGGDAAGSGSGLMGEPLPAERKKFIATSASGPGTRRSPCRTSSSARQ